MKTINVTDETYTALLALGVIKEEQIPLFEVRDDGRIKTIIKELQPFEGTKWVRIDKATKPTLWYFHNIGDVFEVKYHNETTYKGSDDGDYLINFTDCTEVEAHVKELKPWEKFPTLESCWDGGEGELGYCIGVHTGSIDQYTGIYNYSTEAEAKRARATIFLSRIAKKWNEGVEIDDVGYFITHTMQVDCWTLNRSIIHILPFYFHTQELAEKSLEMFPDVWNDFYNK